MKIAIQIVENGTQSKDPRFSFLSKRFLQAEDVDDSFKINDYGFEDYSIDGVSGNEIRVTGVNHTNKWKVTITFKVLVEDDEYVLEPSEALLSEFFGKPSNYVTVFWNPEKRVDLK